MHCSALNDEDGIIFGASSPEMARSTAKTIKEGHLPGNVGERLDALWDICKEDAAGIVQY